MITRRGLLGSILATSAAPAFVASGLMKGRGIIVPSDRFFIPFGDGVARTYKVTESFPKRFIEGDMVFYNDVIAYKHGDKWEIVNPAVGKIFTFQSGDSIIGE